MKFGLITTEGGAYFKEVPEEAIYGEELGFDSVWLEEHHSIRNHYWPSPVRLEELTPAPTKAKIQFAFMNAPLIRHRFTLGDFFAFLNWDQETLWHR